MLDFSFLQRISIYKRLLLLSFCVGMIVFITNATLTFYVTNKTIHKEQITRISVMVESIIKLADKYKAQVERKEITEEEVKAKVKQVVRDIRFDNGNYVWIHDYDSQFVEHPLLHNEKTKNIDAAALQDKKTGKFIVKDMTKLVKEKGEGIYNYNWKSKDDKTKIVPKMSYVKNISGWKWVVGTGVYIDGLQRKILANILLCIIPSFIIFLIAVAVCNITIGQSINDPIKGLITLSNNLANNDLSIQIKDDKTKTEIGELRRSYKSSITNLRGLILEVLTSVEQVSNSSKNMEIITIQLSESAEQTAMSIGKLATGSNEQARDLNESLEEFNNINSSVKKILDNMANTVNVSSETEEIVSEGQNESGKAISKMNTIKTVSNNISCTINELGELSLNIGEIIDLIKNIASQTNLLALNAAIEAARAGDQGKGFAVVAEEVKKLADQSAKATDKINDMITEVQTKTNDALLNMNSGVQEIEEGVEIIDKVGESLDKILTSTKLTNNDVSQVSNMLNELAVHFDSISGKMENIAAITEESAAISEEIASTTQEQSANSSEMATNAEAANKTIKELKEIVSKFKV